MLMLLLSLLVLALFLAAWKLLLQVKKISRRNTRDSKAYQHEDFLRELERLNPDQTRFLQQYLKNRGGKLSLFLLVATMFSTTSLQAQTADAPSGPLLGQAGIIITIILILIPIIAALFFMILKVSALSRRHAAERNATEAARFADYLKTLPPEEVQHVLNKREKALAYKLKNKELRGELPPDDQRGVIQLQGEHGLPFVNAKRKAVPRTAVDPRMSRLVLWYLITATFWLLFGTTVGEYVGIKFVAPDADHVSWLSFGRLRPVHTNAVFWGWASLAMLGLGYYVVPRVGNNTLYSYKWAWYSLVLINLTVLLGTISLMAGINNGGGEYREYIWPIMLLFGIALFLTLINFLKTIARRGTREVYISNWYIVSAVIFGLVIAIVAYWPSWQNGLGETIIQGYYMHQGVGMWFMLFTLGLVYYYLPQQLNKPIYSYSLGILAFWTQILFYTLIGSHHFVFSSIPWWLQTVAIIGSMGMAIPVIAGSTNFIMTFKNGWYKLKDSYTLPFFLVGIIFYFTGSLQGTAEAFRTTNLIWHFTDFTVAHSHLTMYGIICFFVWACIYTIVPRMTQNEAPQITIGAHFWLALIGLLFYTIPLMYGSTMKGMMWLEGKPFIDGIVLMAPHWLWRAIGGSMMWLSHLFFAYNLYKMMADRPAPAVAEQAIDRLKTEHINNKSNEHGLV